MAYSSTQPPYILVGSVGVGMRVWGYDSTHALAALTTAGGFITNGQSLGMQLGDFLFAKSTAGHAGIHNVTAVSSTGVTLVAYVT